MFSLKMFLKQNSSTILTCVGAVGVIATAVSAAKETPKALKLLEKAREEKGEELNNLDKVKAASPAYIPSAIIGVSTIACIFGANILNKRNQASLISAYALLDKAYKEYKKKVSEVYGEEADAKIKEAIAKDNYEDTDISEDEEDLFFDFNSMQYFNSTDDKIKFAEEQANKVLKSKGYISLNEVCDLFGINRVGSGYDVGWSRAAVDYLNFDIEKTVMDNDGLEVSIISTSTEPSINYWY